MWFKPRFVLVFIFLFPIACAGPTAVINPADAQKDAAKKAYNALKEQETLWIRYNPAPCDCTSYEVKTPDGWRRAVLIFSDQAAQGSVEKALHAAFVHGIPGPIRLKARADTIKQGKCRDWCIWVDVKEVNIDTKNH